MTAADVYRGLWRHKFFILLATAALGVATWLAVSKIAPTYEASTLVRVQTLADQSDAAGSLQASQTLARTYAEIINSGALDARVRAILGATGVQVPTIRASAGAVSDLALIWISAKSRVPAVAARVADATSVALRGFARSSAPREQIVTVKKAGVPSSPTSPDKALDVALVVLLGLILNGGIALLLELFSDRLPNTDELEESLGYPVLGTIPALDLVAINAANPPERSGTPLREPGTDDMTSPTEEGVASGTESNHG